MSRIFINAEDIPLKIYLRADPHTQTFQIGQNADTAEEIVTEQMFWGDSETPPLYLQYSEITGRRIKVSAGAGDATYSYTNTECDNWLNNYFFNHTNNHFFIVRGYAGCGKTTLVKYLIKNNSDLHSTNSFYLNVGNNWSYEKEPSLFFEALLSELSRQIERICNARNARGIWNKFWYFCQDGRSFNNELPRIAQEIKKIVPTKYGGFHPAKSMPIKKLAHECALDIEVYLHRNFSESSSNIDRQNKGQISVIFSLLISLYCAEYLANNINDLKKAFILVFDNLDVFTNPATPSEIVLAIWETLSKFVSFYRTNYNGHLPVFRIYITTRKVLYSHIISYLPTLEHSLQLNDCATICDVSELFLSQAVLEHRINYWANRDDISSSTKNKFTQLRKIIPIMGKNETSVSEDRDDLPKQVIDLDGFFNHNYRACVNMLSEIVETNNPNVSFIFQDNNSPAWLKTSTLIYEIASIYRNKNIWSSLGFGCSGCDKKDYPTTLCRVILTYLFISKMGQKYAPFAPPNPDFPTDATVSLNNILNTFSKTSFIYSSTEDNEHQIQEKQRCVSTEMQKNLIISRLAVMCTRGTSEIGAESKGYDLDDNELWRRPLYFISGVKLKHTATSTKELEDYFKNNMSEDSDIRFSITEEGCILISDLVANFEFYSARYCENAKKPLHQCENVNELEQIIFPVLNAIRTCCTRQKIFMNDYIATYGLNDSSLFEAKNKYLSENFHPRTNARFDDRGRRTLKADSFRPQLHIVRVLYNHIAYFNEIKKYFFTKNLPIYDDMCKQLTSYIEEYLKLYHENFYETLESTVGSHNNVVYNELKDLVDQQNKAYESFQRQNIDISRGNQKRIRRN